MGYLAPPRPRVLAHRGLALDAPENTPLAFAYALSAGASYLETDVHLSADGVVVASHDGDLGRLAGSDARVGSLTMAQLARIDLGAGQSFASLLQLLDGFPDARFNIDVKERAAAVATAAVIVEQRAVHRVLVTSFDEGTRQAALAAFDALGSPRPATSASQRGVVLALLGARLGLRPLVRRALAGVDAVQVPERQGPLRVVTPRFVRAVHATGAEVHVWTVNSPDAMRRLLGMGVDGIVSDRADLALEVVGERVWPAAASGR